MRVAGIEHGLDRVDRAGADVAEDHAECADHDGWAQCLLSAHGSHRCRVHACLPVISTFTRERPCARRRSWEPWPTNSTSCTRSSRRSSPRCAQSSPQRRNSAATTTPPNRSPPRASPRRRHGSSTGSRSGTRTSGRGSPGSASGCKDAHAAMDGDRIRELSAEQRRLVDDVARAAFEEAELADPTAALRDDVTGTLQAAIADPDVASRLGRLTKAEQWSGFGEFGDTAMVFTTTRKPARAQAADRKAGARQEARRQAPTRRGANVRRRGRHWPPPSAPRPMPTPR